jgi:hypothetical protein
MIQAIKFYWVEQECKISKNNIGRTRSSDKSPMLWLRGTTVGFRDVTPTISSKQQIHVVGLNTFIQSSNGQNLVEKGSSRNWPKAQPYKEFKVRQWKSAEKWCKGSCLNPPMWPKLGLRVSTSNSNLTPNSSQKISNLRPLCLESDLELNAKIIEDFLRFLMAIYTPSYDQRFKSYRFLNLTKLLKFDSGHNGVTWVIRSLDHLRNGNLVNTENESCRYLLKFPMISLHDLLE